MKITRPAGTGRAAHPLRLAGLLAISIGLAHTSLSAQDQETVEWGTLGPLTLASRLQANRRA